MHCQAPFSNHLFVLHSDDQLFHLYQSQNCVESMSQTEKWQSIIFAKQVVSNCRANWANCRLIHLLPTLITSSGWLPICYTVAFMTFNGSFFQQRRQNIQRQLSNCLWFLFVHLLWQNQVLNNIQPKTSEAISCLKWSGGNKILVPFPSYPLADRQANWVPTHPQPSR